MIDQRLKMVEEVLTEMGVNGTVIWRRTIRGTTKSAIRADALRFLEDECGLKRVNGVWRLDEDKGSQLKYRQAVRDRMDQYKAQKAVDDEAEGDALLEAALVAAGHDPEAWLRE